MSRIVPEVDNDEVPVADRLQVHRKQNADRVARSEPLL